MEMPNRSEETRLNHRTQSKRTSKCLGARREIAQTRPVASPRGIQSASAKMAGANEYADDRLDTISMLPPAKLNFLGIRGAAVFLPPGRRLSHGVSAFEAPEWGSQASRLPGVEMGPEASYIHGYDRRLS